LDFQKIKEESILISEIIVTHLGAFYLKIEEDNYEFYQEII
jgi:hypothetical protein